MTLGSAPSKLLRPATPLSFATHGQHAACRAGVPPEAAQSLKGDLRRIEVERVL